MRKGRIVEKGTHVELMELKQIYFDVVHHQGASETTEKVTSEETSIRSDLDENTVSEVLPLNCDDKFTPATVTLLQGSQKPNSMWSLAMFVHSLNRKDGLLVIFGLVFSLIAGASHPV
jgi:ATP-binding cassette subfamily B (MDR/TAP) protein 1